MARAVRQAGGVTLERVGLDDLGTIPSQAASDEDAHTWRPIDLTAEALKPPEPPSIARFLYPGHVHIGSGEPESAKTWFALVAAAEEILAGNTAVWADFEMGRRAMYERLQALGPVDEQIRAGFLYLEPDQALTPKLRPELELLLAVNKPTLAVVDSWTPALALHGLDPNKAQDIETFRRAVLAPLRSCGSAIFLIDHLVKSKDARGRYSIHSERKLGIADVHLGFEVIDAFGRGRTGRVKVVVHKDRPGWLPRPKAGEIEIASSPETGNVTWQIQAAADQAADSRSDFRPTRLMEKASIYLEHCTDLVTRNTVLAAVTGNEAALRQGLDVLIRDGYVEAQPGTRNSQLLRSIRAYREALDDHS
jgi:hypothetical protein